MNNRFVIINDSFIPEDKAALLVSDLSIQRGYGIFDFFRIINGKPVFTNDHLDRFFYSAAQMRLPVGKTKDELRTLLLELSGKNNLPDSGIRITLTGGYSEDGYTIATPNLVIVQKPLIVNKENSPEGISLVTYAHQRQMPDVKTIDYLMAIWLRPYVLQNNADEVLYHKDGVVTECPRSNIFIINKDQEVITPAANILKGITRKHILEIAGQKFITKEKDVTIEDVLNAEEVFITSTTKQVLPVLKVDGHTIGTGKPGEISLRLREEIVQSVNSF